MSDGGLGLLFDRVVVFRLELRNDGIDAVIEVGRLVGRAGDDQRRPGFVDQDAVDFVHDREIQFALHALIQGRDDEIVTKIVEPVFVVRAVRNVGAVCLESGAGAKMLQPLVGGIVRRVVR